MAARITKTELETLMGAGNLSDLGDVAIQLYIDSANRFVESIFLGTTLTELQLKDIEYYLAAYFLNVRKVPPASVSMGGQSVSRQGSFFFAGLLGDVYGQRAVLLDTTGKLSELATSLHRAATGRDDSPAESIFVGLSDANTDLLT